MIASDSRWWPVFPALLLLSCVWACSDDTAGDTDSGTARDGGGDARADGGAGASEYDGYCDARGARCSESPDDVASCKQEGVCFEGSAKPEAIPMVVACLDDLACGADDEPCFAAASAALADAASNAAERMCQARNGECPDAFNDDYCFGLGLATEDYLMEFVDCLALDCAMVDGCLEDLSESGCV
jgi:hypothetical protein